MTRVLISDWLSLLANRGITQILAFIYFDIYFGSFKLNHLDCYYCKLGVAEMSFDFK